MRNNCERCARLINKRGIHGEVYSECAKIDDLSADQMAKAEYGKGCPFYKEAE